MLVLVGDIGGTYARLLLTEVQGEACQHIAEATYDSRYFSNLTEVIKLFFVDNKITTSLFAACLAVAGPVKSGIASITNLPWIVSEKELSELLQTPRVKLINDFIAVAYGVTELEDEDILLLQNGKKEKTHPNIIVIGAGTGLGAANLVWVGEHYITLSSEVGHTGFAPENKIQTKLLSWLQNEHSHVSLEMVLSGGGLVLLYQFFHQIIGLSESEEVKAAMLLNDPAQVISDYALANKDPLCLQALECFVDIYGAAAGNIALHYFSSTELYIAGGIAAKIKDKMSEQCFLNAFFNKGLMSENMKKITVKLILQDKIGLYGAIAYIKQKMPRLI